MEAMEGARKLRVEDVQVGDVPAPKKVRSLTGHRGMAGEVPD
jgi:hypothetical protein